MKTKNICIVVLLLAVAFIGRQAKAQFVLVDNFSNAVQGNLSGQTSDGPSHAVWQAANSASVVTVTNSTTLGVGTPGSGTPLTTNAASIYDNIDGAAYIALPTSIPTSSTQATIFMQFDMGPDQSLDNVNWDIANTIAPTGDAGGSNQKIELNANVTGPGAGRYGVSLRNGGTFVTLSASGPNGATGANQFVPANSTVYNVWFVVNNSAQNYVMYMQDANPTNTDLPALTKMYVSTTGAGAAAGGSYTWTTNAIGFRNTTAGALNDFILGTGGTQGPQRQYTYAIYEDPNGLDLTNPITGAAPLFLAPPVITSEPLSVEIFAGSTATFTIGATGGGLSYQWETNGVAIGNGGNVSGATSSTLTITGASAANGASYSCVITNANISGYNSTNSTGAPGTSVPAGTATLTIVSPNGAFETALAAANPLHFYAFDDTGSPAGGTEVAVDYEGGDNGIYGSHSYNGFNSVAGPTPSAGYPGFSSANYAVEIADQGEGNGEPEHVAISSPWNLNTNTVTITAWIYPLSDDSPVFVDPQYPSAAIVFNSGSGNDVEGLNYTANGLTLGYTWNNDAGTTSWDSGLMPPVLQWSFVSLVVTPTNATISIMNTSGLLSSTHVYPHVVAAFGGTTMIGDESGFANASRTFSGDIDEVGVFNQALTQGQLQSIFTNASQVALYPPTNWVSLVTAGTIYPGMSAQFSSINGGSVPLSYEWRLNGVNLADGANSVGMISGSATPSLTISSLAVGDAGQSYNLTLVTSNSSGSYTSSPPAVLTVTTPGAATTINTLGIEAAGDDWNTATNWSDTLSASNSAFSVPGSTYYIVPGTMERTPNVTNAAFPGVKMVIQGDGTISDGGSASFPTNVVGLVTNVTGELRLKEPSPSGGSGYTSATNFGTVYSDGGPIYFPDLQLAGGQVDNGSSAKVTLNGQIDVLSNSAIYVDSSSGGSIRTIQINSFLTGNGTVRYGYLGSANYTNNDLVIAGTTNTFSGQWNILQGALLGNAPNSLGTNTITIGTNAALETTYNVNNTNANLILYGRMFLYTTNTFNAMTVNGQSVSAGTYTSAQLNGQYPGNFPTNWNVQVGSQTGTNTGVGQITVLKTLLPQIIQQPTPASLSLYPGQTAQFTISAGGATSYQWWFTNLSNVGSQLSDGGVISGSHSNVLTISSVASGNAGNYMVVLSNSVGSVTSSIVTLTVLSTSAATTITLPVVETAGQDWNTTNVWNDGLGGLPASVSAYAEPGSIYVVLPTDVLRTPVSPANTAFPGSPLIISQAGGVNGELLLEHSGAGSMAFPDLQLDGLMDNGADGLATLTGQINVTNNVTIYTDTNQPAGLVVNFDAPGGVGGTNYAGLGAYPDHAGHTYWNPVSGDTGTTPASTNSDGVTTSAVTLTMDSEGFPVGGNGVSSFAYGTWNDHTNTTPIPAVNTPVALEDDYVYLGDEISPNLIVAIMTNTLNNVPAGTYNLYLYGNNGGGGSGWNQLGGQKNNWGTTFTVSSDTTPATSLSTSNQAASFNSNTFIQGADYVLFSNVVVATTGDSITIAWTPNTNVVGNFTAAFNGLQLVAVTAAAAGPRPFEISSLLTGNGTITYAAGDTNFASDLDIADGANTFSGQWNVVQGALLGGAANSLGTNTITVGTNGALETVYGINDTNAGLVLNGKMFLHTSDTFKTLTVNGVTNSAGTYSWSQLNTAYPANFPSGWPMQTNSAVSSGSGSITVLFPAGSSSTNTTLVVLQSGSSLILSWTNNAGTTLETTTNLLSGWTPVAGATSPYTNNITATNGPAQFYRIHPFP